MGRQIREHNKGRVIGPDGLAITLSDLPGPDTKRWVPRRKAIVVAAVDGGLLSLDDVCRRYNLSIEEFFSWEDALHQHGLAGLRATHPQKRLTAPWQAPAQNWPRVVAKSDKNDCGARRGNPR